MFTQGLLNVFIRSLILTSKFLTIFFIAHFLSVEEMGIYGLFNVTIGIFIYFLGMDFYTFNTRELLSATKTNQACMIRDQLVFHMIIYVIVLPFLSIIFFADFLAWNYMFLFYCLLIVEHLSQEASRILITFSLPLWANIIQLIRSGLWIYFAVGVALIFPSFCNIITFLCAWSIGSIISLIVALYIFRKKGFYLNFQHNVNWKWIKTGTRQSSIFFFGTLALLLSQYIDRYMLKYYYGDALVGIYTLYWNIANVVNVFVYSGVIIIVYPKIVEAYRNNKIAEYNKLIKKLSINTLSCAVLLGFIAFIGINPILYIINKQLYYQYLPAFWLVLIASVVNVIAQIPHYILYAKNNDIAIFTSTVITMILSVILNILIIPDFGILGAAISNLCAMICLLLFKLWYVRYGTVFGQRKSV